MFDPQAAAPAMTLAEKAAFLTGATAWTTPGLPRLGVPPLTLTDGPHGVRKQLPGARLMDLDQSEPATAFPAASATGCSWDPALLAEIGAALAAESRALGTDVLLGPGVNIKRSPLCGRNFEYFSEDPVLSGELAAAWVRGLQDGGAGACVKHFAANNQETDRMRVSAEVDERTLREIYLPAFERVVTRAQPATVMCSYNRLNGIPASEHRWLLTEVLRAEWGFGGFTVSDWGAVTDRVAALAAGLDLQMPADGGPAAAALVAAVSAGTLPEAVLDRAVERILRVTARLTGPRGDSRPAVDHERHHALARRAAAGSAVLLTNEDEFLPLDPAAGGTLAVIGEFARTPRYQGGGSSQVVPTRLDSALAEITAAVAGRRDVVFAPGFTLDGAPSPELLAGAVAAARSAADVVMFLGLPEAAESEGFDRTAIGLPATQLDVLRAVAAVSQRVAVVLSNGGVVATRPVTEQARAVLEMWLPGQAGGGAAADLLFGAAEPGGRLAETIPLALSDNPSYVNFPGAAGRVRYGERIYVGYRWYDKVARDVAHPFGHGLSYTTFAYSGLQVEVPDPARPAAVVRFTLANTGRRAGSEVAQVYVSDPEASADRPERELKAFRKVRLAPGESCLVELALTERDFAFWDEQRRGWTAEPGTFRIAVGASSRDLRLTAEIELTPPLPPTPLTLDSTIGEWLAAPSGRDALMAALAAAPGGTGEIVIDDSMLAMAAPVPFRQALALGFAAIPSGGEAAFLARANAGLGG
jgi:beta-glucosidase